MRSCMHGYSPNARRTTGSGGGEKPPPCNMLDAEFEVGVYTRPRRLTEHLLTNQVLYQLSYTGTLRAAAT